MNGKVSPFTACPPTANPWLLPAYATPRLIGHGSAAAPKEGEASGHCPRDHKLIPSGIAIRSAIFGSKPRSRPRSRLAAKHGSTCSYRAQSTLELFGGESKSSLINHGQIGFIIERGDRIAQMVIQPCFRSN
ncbi:UNVERIFIED_CONTAM: hypothetical protein GTU68_009470 [Idotea baltica]|nr:hypothetical protein [Idotea baltica]